MYGSVRPKEDTSEVTASSSGGKTPTGGSRPRRCLPPLSTATSAVKKLATASQLSTEAVAAKAKVRQAKATERRQREAKLQAEAAKREATETAKKKVAAAEAVLKVEDAERAREERVRREGGWDGDEAEVRGIGLSAPKKTAVRSKKKPKKQAEGSGIASPTDDPNNPMLQNQAEEVHVAAAVAQQPHVASSDYTVATQRASAEPVVEAMSIEAGDDDDASSIATEQRGGAEHSWDDDPD